MQISDIPKQMLVLPAWKQNSQFAAQFWIRHDSFLALFTMAKRLACQDVQWVLQFFRPELDREESSTIILTLIMVVQLQI